MVGRRFSEVPYDSDGGIGKWPLGDFANANLEASTASEKATWSFDASLNRESLRYEL